METCNPSAKDELCDEILSLCRSLRLTTRIYDACEEAGTPAQLEFVRDMLAAEVAQRDENRLARLLRKAAFPSIKTFEGYETDQITFPDGFSIKSIQDGTFITDKLNLVLYGPVGTGKTHLAIAAGVAACALGFSVRFFTIASLVRQLGQAVRNDRIDRLMGDLSKIDLLILDEWGYVPIDKDGVRLLFQVVADCYESRSIIITTNLEFSRWGTVLADDQMAAAIIDRIVHHGRLLYFQGQSYRLRNALINTQASCKQQ